MKLRKKDIDKQKTDKTLFVYNHRKEIIKKLDKWMSDKYYDIRPLIQCNSEYLVAFGEKSNGKSTAMQMVACICYWLYGVQSVLLRLYNEDFLKGRAEKMFGGIPSGFISKLTNDKYDHIVYKRYAWYFAKTSEDEKENDIVDEKAFCFRQCILNAGSSFQMPEVEIILFDEFIRKDTQRNVSDEFVEFQTVISTIKRNKTSLQIFMMGNTVNYYSVYFKEMGLKNIRQQVQGSIDTYTYGSSDLSVSVEYCKTPEGKNQAGNKYFAFNNPKLEMITGGKWQLDIYPHLPRKYRPKDIILTYFIKFDDTMFQCDIVGREANLFTYIHTKIDHTVDYNRDVIYQIEDDSRPNVLKNITRPMYDFQQKIYKFFIGNKVFYENNEVGDMIHAYLKWCIA